MALSGKRGDVKVDGSTFLKATEWSCNLSQEALECTNKGSAGWREYVEGLLGCEFSLTANWDAVINDGNPPFPISNQGAEVVFYIDAADGSNIGTVTFDAIFETFEISSATSGIVTYSVSGKANGPVTYAIA